MSTIQFLHANGFGAKTYSYFFSLLQPYNISAIDIMAHGKYEPAPNWRPLADEVIEHIEAHQTEPIVGVGHSFGGAALLYAAQKRPDLFNRVIFLDPPIFNPKKQFLFKILKFVGQYDKVSPAGRAKSRRQYFPSKEAAYEYFASKKLFRSFHEQCLKDYANFGITPNPEHGFELTFSREVEYQVFRQAPNIRRKIKLKMPSHFIYSNHYKVLQQSDIQWLKKILPNTQFMDFDGGHLFPQEKPKEVTTLIKSLIE